MNNKEENQTFIHKIYTSIFSILLFVPIILARGKEEWRKGAARLLGRMITDEKRCEPKLLCAL